MEVQIRAYQAGDLPEMIRIWNEVVEEGNAFPQEEMLTAETGERFFAGQTYCAVAVCMDYTYCIQTMWDAAVICAMPVMRSAVKAGGCTSVKSW